MKFVLIALVSTFLSSPAFAAVETEQKPTPQPTEKITLQWMAPEEALRILSNILGIEDLSDVATPASKKKKALILQPDHRLAPVIRELLEMLDVEKPI